jgi:hypothetical protein
MRSLTLVFLALAPVGVLSQRVSKDATCGGSTGNTCNGSAFGNCCSQVCIPLKVDEAGGQLLIYISSMDGVVAQMPTAAKVARPVSASVLKPLLLDRPVLLQRLRPAVARLLLSLDLRQVCLSQQTRDAEHPLEAKHVWEAAGVTVALSITGVAQAKVCFYSTGEDASKIDQTTVRRIHARKAMGSATMLVRPKAALQHRLPHLSPRLLPPLHQRWRPRRLLASHLWPPCPP